MAESAIRIKEAIENFINNEDIDEGNEMLRNEIATLGELRYAIALAKQDYPNEYEDVLDALISL